MASPHTALAATATAATGRALDKAAAEATARAKVGGSSRVDRLPAVINPGEGAELWGLRFQTVLRPLAGVVVTAVAPGSVAALAGIQVGWMVEAIGNTALGDPKWSQLGGVSKALALFDQWLQSQVDEYLGSAHRREGASNRANIVKNDTGSNEMDTPVRQLHLHFGTASPSEVASSTFQASGTTTSMDGKASSLSSLSSSLGAVRLASALSVHVDAPHQTIVLRHVPGPKLQAINYVAMDFSETKVRHFLWCAIL